MSRSFRLLTEYREPSPSIEYRHRVSSTVTEYRVPSPSIEVPSPSMEVSSTITVSRIEYRVPNSKLSRRTSHPSYAARSNLIPTSKLVKMYEVRVLILQGGIKKGREMTPVDRMDMGKDMGLDRGACNGCNGRRGSS